MSVPETLTRFGKHRCSRVETHVGGDNDDCGDEVEDDDQVMMLMEMMRRFAACIVIRAEWLPTLPTLPALLCDYFRRRR